MKIDRSNTIQCKCGHTWDTRVYLECPSCTFNKEKIKTDLSEYNKLKYQLFKAKHDLDNIIAMIELDRSLIVKNPELVISQLKKIFQELNKP